MGTERGFFSSFYKLHPFPLMKIGDLLIHNTTFFLPFDSGESKRGKQGDWESIAIRVSSGPQTQEPSLQAFFFFFF